MRRGPSLWIPNRKRLQRGRLPSPGRLLPREAKRSGLNGARPSEKGMENPSEPTLLADANGELRGFSRFAHSGTANSYLTLTGANFGMSAQMAPSRIFRAGCGDHHLRACAGSIDLVVWRGASGAGGGPRSARQLAPPSPAERQQEQLSPLIWRRLALELLGKPPRHSLPARGRAGSIRCRYARCPGEKAGEGNRTLVSSLEGYSFTIKLHPRAPIKLTRLAIPAKSFSDLPAGCVSLTASPN